MAVAEALGILSVLSSLGSGAATISGGLESRKAAFAQSLLQEQQARNILFQGKVLQHRIRYAGYKSRGEAAASYGGAGVKIAGSAKDRLADIDRQVEEDVFMAEYNATTGALAARTQAGITAAYGRQLEQAGLQGGIISALSGITQAGGYYYGYRGYRGGNDQPPIPTGATMGYNQKFPFAMIGTNE